MNPKIQEALNSLIQAIQEETVAQFSSLLAGGQVGNGRSTSRVSSVPKARPKGGKRTSQEIEAFKNTILSAIRKSPGIRSEQLAKELGTTTKELQLPMLQLRESKAIRMKGQKRAAQYFAK